MKIVKNRVIHDNSDLKFAKLFFFQIFGGTEKIEISKIFRKKFFSEN